MEQEALDHLLARFRTDARLHCLCGPRQLGDLVDRGLPQREVGWIAELGSECEEPPVHSIFHGACATE